MKVLVACEFSGIVRDAFKALGHDAWSCDLLPTEKEGQHIQGDVLEILHMGWDLMIAHPPCTYLCNSGVVWLHREQDRWEKMRESALFFKMLMDAPIHRIAIENPIMHKYAKSIIGKQQTQTIQPYDFGHPESKGTCLWLKNLPKLISTKRLFPTKVSEKSGKRLWENQSPSGSNNIPPSDIRWKLRSKTYSGIAEAMAFQWSLDYQCRQLELPFAI